MALGPRIAMTTVSGLMLASSALASEEACGAREVIIDELQAQYDETRHSAGLQGEEKLIEIWTSPISGTWTMLVTTTDGTTCIAAAGNNWHDFRSPRRANGKES